MLRKHALSLVEGPSAFLALPSETPYSQRAPFATSPGAAPLDGLFEHPVSLFKQGMEILQVTVLRRKGFSTACQTAECGYSVFSTRGNISDKILAILKLRFQILYLSG